MFGVRFSSYRAVTRRRLQALDASHKEVPAEGRKLALLVRMVSCTAESRRRRQSCDFT